MRFYKIISKLFVIIIVFYFSCVLPNDRNDESDKKSNKDDTQDTPDTQVKDTKFTVRRGFYDAPFYVDITTNTEGATIVYTLDGSDPRTSSRSFSSNCFFISFNAELCFSFSL